MTVTTVGVLMAGIDSRIVIVGFPEVAAALHANAEEAIWFTQSYMLGSTVALLLIGRMTDIYGRVKIYNLGFVVFTVGSFLSSASLNPAMLIGFRAIQGLGSGVIFTNSAAIITDATPKDRLGLSLGVNQLGFRFGGMAGLTLSGLILSALDWRALFYINVPIGIFGTVWAHRRLKEIAKLDKGRGMDWVGISSFMCFVTSLLLALTYTAYGISQSTLYVVILLALISMVSITVFVWQERRSREPMLDLGLLKIREFTAGVSALLLNAIAWGAVLLLLSLYLQLSVGLSPFDAGIRILPLEIAFLASGPLSGLFSDRAKYLVPLTTSGLALTSISLFLFSTVGETTPYIYTAAYMVLVGIGSGLFVSPNIRTIMASVPIERRGIASAFRAMLWSVGFTVSLSIAVLFMTFTAPYSLITSMITSSLNPLTIPLHDRVLFVESLRNTYVWLGIINSLAIPFVLVKVKLPAG
ncbi:MAG: MFS transporter [Nitrososphaerota archaeon]|nr:MFS transporter [Nitrososphaerota archaeon]